MGIVRMMRKMGMWKRKSKTVDGLRLSLRPIVIIVPMYNVCGMSSRGMVYLAFRWMVM
jgi:hypothetical protein